TELQILGQAAHIVMAFNVCGSGAVSGLDNVGIQGALHQIGNASSPVVDDFAFGGFKHADKLTADDFTFVLGVFHAVELLEELRGGIDNLEIDAGCRNEIGLYLGGLALP